MGKKESIFQEYKKEIIVSLIVTVILNLLSILLNYFKDGGRVVTNVFTDLIYYNMGRISDYEILNGLSSFVLGFIIASMIVLILSATISNKFKIVEAIRKNKKVLKKIYGLFGIIGTIFITIYSFSIIYCVEAKHSFDLTMTYLKPYIPSEDYDKMYSYWVSMVNKEDYKFINKKIKELKCTYTYIDENIKDKICN